MKNNISNSAKKSWVNLEDLKALIDLARDTDVSELEIEKGGIRVRIKMPSNSTSRNQRKVSENVITPSSRSEQIHSPNPVEVDKERYHLVSSPIVGTFYRAPSPQADPYVNAGDTVKKGQILCIIEAMKLMNEIEAEVDGKIVEILVEDGKPVEYGEVLFKIEPLS